MMDEPGWDGANTDIRVAQSFELISRTEVDAGQPIPLDESYSNPPDQGVRAREPERATEGLWSWRDHLPIVITASSAIFAGMRIISVSAYNPETATGILQGTGTAAVIVGAIVPVFGLVMFPLAVMLGLAIKAKRVSDSSREAAIILCGFLVAGSVAMTPLLEVAIALFFAALATILYCLLGLNSRWMRGEREWLSYSTRRGPFYILGASALLMAVVLVLSQKPWVPAERIVSTKMRPFIGYVLDETDTDMTILTARGRQIVHLTPGEVVNRTVCQPRDDIFTVYASETLPTLVHFSYSKPYPICYRQAPAGATRHR